LHPITADRMMKTQLSRMQHDTWYMDVWLPSCCGKTIGHVSQQRMSCITPMHTYLVCASAVQTTAHSHSPIAPTLFSLPVSTRFSPVLSYLHFVTMYRVTSDGSSPTSCQQTCIPLNQ